MTDDEDLWSDEICALVDAAFETVSRNPSDHDEAVAYRRAIAAALRQPIRNDIKEADTAAMESILWVDTIIDDQEAIAKAFARHRQHGYDQGYYDGQRDRQLMQDNALRDALEAAPLIHLWESKEDFRRRQDGWLKTKYRAALEQSK